MFADEMQEGSRVQRELAECAITRSKPEAPTPRTLFLLLDFGPKLQKVYFDEVV